MDLYCNVYKYFSVAIDNLTIHVTYQLQFLTWYQTFILQYLHENLTDFSLWWFAVYVLSPIFV